MKLRLGLIGLGQTWENRYRAALRAMGDRFEVAAVFDQVTHRARSVASELEAVPVDGFRCLVRREDVDAILVLTDGWYGVLPVLSAFNAGKSVYYAASVDIAPEEAEDLCRRARRAGIAFLAELARRHSPATIRLKELIATALGAPKLLFCHMRSPGPLPTNHQSSATTADPCRRELVQLVDWCRFVVGSQPRWVTSTAHQAPAAFSAGEVQNDYWSMSLDFSERGRPGTGALAQISCSSYIPLCWSEAIGYRPHAAMQIACERGIAFLDLPSTLVWFDEAGRHQESLDSERPLGERLLTRFHWAVTSLVAKTSDLEDACQAIGIVEQAARSHAEGCRIELEPWIDPPP